MALGSVSIVGQRIARDVEELEALRLRAKLTPCPHCGQIGAEDYERVRHVESIRGVRVPRGRALPGCELRALFGVCDPETPGGARNAALLAVLYGGGLRRSETVGHDLEDFDTTTGVLKVKGKGNNERVSYITSGARQALDAWLLGSHIEAILRARSSCP